MKMIEVFLRACIAWMCYYSDLQDRTRVHLMVQRLHGDLADGRVVTFLCGDLLLTKGLGPYPFSSLVDHSSPHCRLSGLALSLTCLDR